MTSFLTTDVLCAVPPSQRFNETRLLEYLRKNIDICPKTGSMAVSKFGFGQSNPTFLLTLSSNIKFVLRKQPSGTLLQSAHAIDREYRVMSALQNSHVPVPKTYHLCLDKSIIGTPFYICEFIIGRIFTKSHLPSLKSQQRYTIYAELNRVLSAIHSINISDVGLHDYSHSSADHITRLINRWNKQYNSSKTKQSESIIQLKQFYNKINEYNNNLRKDEYNSQKMINLIHGDYRLDNVIFDDKSLRILAVIDWELSTIGNPLTDLATFCLGYHLPANTGTLPGLLGIDLYKSGIPDELWFIRKYISQLNVRTASLIKYFVFPIRDWNFYLSIAIYRYIGILQGIFKRMSIGNASNPTNKISPKLALTFLSVQGLNIFKEADVYKKLLIIPKAVLSKNEADHLPIYLEPWRDHFKNSKFFDLRRKLLYFMGAYIYPAEKQGALFYSNPQNEWKHWHGLEVLQNKAKELGLFNIFLPEEYPEGPGLTNLQYAPLSEIMGRSASLAPEACNCSAPDTGNMEVLAKYGNKYQKEKYLVPLMEGKIRSCFGMTEPAVASSDASNIQLSMIKSSDGSHYIINGRKHWTSGAMDRRCKVCILMGKTDVNASKYRQQSMFVIPMNLPGIRIVRHLNVFGYTDAPHGHAEVVFNNVKVNKNLLILGEGRGFEISQGRLGPGRIHHCMRSIGTAERALQLMKHRCLTRYAFGNFIARYTSIQQDIADSRSDIEQARLLVLQSACMMDKVGNKKARKFISMIKVVVPNMALKVIDRAIQAHGGIGVCQDTPLPKMWAGMRTLRLADGPDAVHQRVIARLELKQSKL